MPGDTPNPTFGVGDLPGPGRGGGMQNREILEKIKWAWEAISGIRTCPYLSRSVRIDFGTPYGLGRNSTGSFGIVCFFTEIDGTRRNKFLSFRKKEKRVLMGVVVGGGGVEPGWK